MRVEADRRLHRDQRQQLKQMVRHHVAERAGGVVEAAAMADADLLVDGDLHMVDVIAIPDRLEHAVGEAQHQDVLHRFLAEIVIDPVDLVLVYDVQQFVVQGFRRGEVGAERLFDHQPPPCAVGLLQHAGAAELAADRCERGRRRRQIEQPVAAGRAVGFQFLQPLPHGVERGGVLWIGLDAGDAFQKAGCDLVVHRAGGVLAQALHQAVAQGVVRGALAGDADHAEFVGQQSGGFKIIERGHHQPVRQVAGGAEDHEGAGVRLLLVGKRALIWEGVCHERPAFGLTMSGAFCRAGSGCCCGSLWPPKPARIAERIFSAKVCSLRERKRANKAAVSTSAGTASSIAALTVQRPSPESSTKPE